MGKKKLEFGKTRLRSIYASPDNPQRDGIYVETVRKTGKMNKGTHYRLTDGVGNFWEMPREFTEIISENESTV